MLTTRDCTPNRLKSALLFVTTVNPLTKVVAAIMASGVLALNCCLSIIVCSAIAQSILDYFQEYNDQDKQGGGVV